MAQRANAELNNQSADADKQAQKVRDLESRAREYRHRISSLEYQLDTMKQECEDVKDGEAASGDAGQAEGEEVELAKA